jgi:hypothetical protein
MGLLSVIRVKWQKSLVSNPSYNFGPTLPPGFWAPFSNFGDKKNLEMHVKSRKKVDFGTDFQFGPILGSISLKNRHFFNFINF